MRRSSWEDGVISSYDLEDVVMAENAMWKPEDERNLLDRYWIWKAGRKGLLPLVEIRLRERRRLERL